MNIYEMSNDSVSSLVFFDIASLQKLVLSWSSMQSFDAGLLKTLARSLGSNKLQLQPYAVEGGAHTRITGGTL